MAVWPYSTKRWQRLRLAHLSAEPCCRYCAAVGLTTPATLVDHIVPVRDAPDRAFDPENLCGLCASCHSGAKQSADRTGTMPGCTLDGRPLDPGHHWNKGR